MSKSKKKRRHATGPPPNTAAPKVHVKIAVADADLRAAGRLIKPALLYADRVTIYSPAASLVSAVEELGSVKGSRNQIATVLEVAASVPQLADRINVPPETLEQFKAMLALDPRLVRRIGRAHGAGDQIDGLYSMLDEFRDMWDQGIPEAVASAREAAGADELLLAVKAGAVKIADLTDITTSDLIADTLRAATHGPQSGMTDDLLSGFLARLIEMVTERGTFPLLDPDATGLIQSLTAAGTVALPGSSMTRGAEISSAVAFMGYLPHFPNLGMDEVLDLRKTLAKPLIRFRAATARLSREFETRPIDDDFDDEVQAVWSREVAPALADIREALAEHGLLREVASIAGNDPRRLLTEAGGVVAAAHGGVIPLSGLLSASLAAAVPGIDLLGRALTQRATELRTIRKSAFYFLHRLDEASR